MSSRRSRQQSASTRISDDQIIDLVSKLRQLVPEIRDRRSDKRTLANKPLPVFPNWVASKLLGKLSFTDAVSNLRTTIRRRHPRSHLILWLQGLTIVIGFVQDKGLLEGINRASISFPHAQRQRHSLVKDPSRVGKFLVLGLRKWALS
ncbi:hypothetical protein V8G54_013620 [Vigna mungo]|uniref:Uncharacterized protein n=1 Tax=Vigna mungo TaxID=3915 RepID=A0AAQ3S532_VIGMU